MTLNCYGFNIYLTFIVPSREVPDDDSHRRVTTGAIRESEGVIAVIADPDQSVVGRRVDALVGHFDAVDVLAIFQGQTSGQTVAIGAPSPQMRLFTAGNC